jgi:endonuclease-3
MGVAELEDIVNKLEALYKVEEHGEKPFEVLIHGILSTRTKDEVTFPAQDRLLISAGTPEKMLKLSDKRIEKLIFPVCFYKTKAKLIKRTCAMLLSEFNGEVPSEKKDLMKLPGVGPKVASLVRVWGFSIPTIPVDTHVNRISWRLGITKKGTKPEDTQEILEVLVPEKLKIEFNRLFVLFGKDICRPIGPQCFRCPIFSYCKYDKKWYYRKRGEAKA